jgi:hypothetical protein
MYSTTEEYRHVLRQIVHMDPTKHYSDEQFEIDDSLDEETLDEFHYDDDAMSAYLDKVYQTTHTHPLFSRMYLAAAALMISTNPEIGLAILFSYDYLGPFYLCYQSYLLDPDAFSENNQFYHSIIERLEK